MSHVDVIEDKLLYPNTNITVDNGGTRILRQVKEEHLVSCD